MLNDATRIEQKDTNFESQNDDDCAQWSHGNKFSHLELKYLSHVAFRVAPSAGIVPSAPVINLVLIN